MDDGSEDIQGMDVTKLPDYVTRYPELYAPEEAKIGEVKLQYIFKVP